MDQVTSNPFYFLGLAANSSERQIQKQVATIKAYAKVGQSVDSKLDFPILPSPQRNEQTISAAVSKIEQPSDRLYHSLFWFIDTSNVDKTALAYLLSDDPAKAAEIWQLAVADRSLGPKNFSAANNLSTLQFLFAFQSGSVNRKLLLPAIQLKGKLLANCFGDMSRAVVGEKVSVDRRELFRRFADAFLASRLLIDRGIPGFIAAFEDFPQDTRSYINGRITSGPAARIRRAIETSETRREDHPEKANEIGLELHEATRDDLVVIRNVHGADHPQSQLIANDLANEILQCSIDYFNEHVESGSIDPGEDSAHLLRIARSIGPSGAVKHRIDENAPTIESWNNESSERSKAKNLEKDIGAIIAKLKWLDTGPIASQRANEMLRFCKAPLANLAAVLGTKAELYLKICDSVASSALRISVASVNSFDDLIEQGRYDRNLFFDTFFRFREEISEAIGTMSLLQSIDMSGEVRNRCEENRRALANIAREFGISSHRTHERRQVNSGNAARSSTGRSSAESGDLGWVRRAELWLSASPFRLFGSAAVFGVVVIGFLLFMGSNASKSLSSNNSNRLPEPPKRMALITGTTFLMGSNISYNEVERPAHPVTVRSFFIDLYEVTNREYIEFSQATGHPFPRKGRVDTPELDHPVVGVTYHDALAFAKWKGKRLPTEEEWELAASGRDHFKYPWGNTWVEGRANVVGSGFKGLTPVGIFGSGYGFGLRDTIGNAWEWTSSDFRPYPGGKLPKEYSGKTGLKTLRGGSYSSTKEYATTYYRIGWPPSGAPNYDQIGFRLAMDVPNSDQKNTNSNSGRNR